MEEGIQKGVASCMLWGIEDESDWDEYDDVTRKELHERLAGNLKKGMEPGNGVCAFALATYLTEGTMGFEKNIEEGLDTVLFSEPLTCITKECGLKKNVTMYVDKDGFAKDLEDNAVGTMLYGHGQEIRGAVIIAMEDSRYDTYSFDTEEDIENVFEAIFNLTG